MIRYQHYPVLADAVYRHNRAATTPHFTCCSSNSMFDAGERNAVQKMEVKVKLSQVLAGWK